MSKYQVTAVVVDLTAEPHTIGVPSVETVDTAEDAIYAGCATLRDVEFQYESFWNYLNSDDKVHRPSEKVKVLNVVRVEGDAPEHKNSSIHAAILKAKGLR